MLPKTKKLKRIEVEDKKLIKERTLLKILMKSRKLLKLNRSNKNEDTGAA